MATPTGSKAAVYGYRIFGQATAKLTFRADTKQFISLVNRLTGNFQGGPFRHAVTDVNDRAARFVAQGMVLRLKEKVDATDRPQLGTNRLEISIMSEENREATVSGFRVGRISWLDRSPAALYYRRIEEGDTQTYGAYVLFSNGLQTHGPFRPGGGNRVTAPTGYKHAFMPQGQGVWVPDIGPYPAYHYSRGGIEAFRKYDIAGRYYDELKRVGVPIEVFQRKK